jgi:hypothetical protein
MENDQRRLERLIGMQIEQHREEANNDGKSDDDNFSMPTQVALEDETYPWTNRDNLMSPARNQPLPNDMRLLQGTGALVVLYETIAQAVGLQGLNCPRQRGVGERGIDKTNL